MIDWLISHPYVLAYGPAAIVGAAICLYVFFDLTDDTRCGG